MVTAAPKLMDSSFEKLIEQMRVKARDSVPGWNIPDEDPSAWPNVDPGLALLKIFAHMQMEIVSRLNRVPDKNFAAFLDMIGISLQPARPARVPVTFYPVEDFPEPIFVAAGTPLSTSETETHPALAYQTTKSFSACDTPIIGMYSIDPVKDEIYDHLPDMTAERSLQPFRGENLQRHILYLGHSELFRVGGNTDIKLRFSSASASEQMAGNLIWEYTGVDGSIKEIDADADSNEPDTVTLRGISGIKETEVNGISSLWISCRQNGGNSSLPEIKAIKIANLGFPDGRAVKPDYACYNFMPLNLQDKIYPFGRNPRPFDSFYICNREVFSKAGAEVRIEFTMPENAIGSTDPKLALTWECSDGQIWKIIAPKERNDTSNLISTGYIIFELPQDIQECDVNGVQNHWIRATITEGDYGHEEVVKQPNDTYIVKNNFHPPCLSSIKISLSNSNIDDTSGRQLEHCLAYNNLQYKDLTEKAKGEGEGMGFKPFVGLPGIGSGRALFIGFKNPFLEGNISLFFYVNEALKPSINPSIAWSYWGGDISLLQDSVLDEKVTELRLQSSEQLMPGTELLIQEAASDPDTGNVLVNSDLALISSLLDDGWVVLDRRLGHLYTRNALVTRRIRLQCQDSTEYLTRAETLDFMAPADQKKTIILGKEGYWLTGSLDEAGELSPLSGVYPNTVWAEQSEKVTDEILGSSDGEKDMSFGLQNRPMISCEVWILEGMVYSEQEKAQLKEDLSIIEVTDDSGSIVDTWVRWTESDDLYESGPDSRHFVLDRALGQISFGDGKMGKIPPIGTDNIKATYTWGGGLPGNVASGEINSLSESLAGVDRVVNHQPAEGGSDTEAVAAALERGPHLIRHRNRAVTLEDYERLAKEASSFIARTRCHIKAGSPGILHLIVIPRGREDRPTPSQGLMDLVKDYLMEKSACALSPDSLRVVPPTYREVSISADVYPISIDLAVPLKRTIIDRLNSYLHPLTGGPDGSGWEFGRSIYRSDLYSMLEGIDGVDHVENLLINERDSDLGTDEDIMEIPCSGRQNIKIVIGA